MAILGDRGPGSICRRQAGTRYLYCPDHLPQRSDRRHSTCPLHVRLHVHRQHPRSPMGRVRGWAGGPTIESVRLGCRRNVAKRNGRWPTCRVHQRPVYPFVRLFYFWVQTSRERRRVGGSGCLSIRVHPRVTQFCTQKRKSPLFPPGHSSFGHRRQPVKGPGGPAELEPLQLNAVLGQDLPKPVFRAGQAAPDLPPQFLAAPLAADVLP